MSLDAEELQAFPKVSLNDHLEAGCGLRRSSIWPPTRHVLPADNALILALFASAELGIWCAIWTFARLLR